MKLFPWSKQKRARYVVEWPDGSRYYVKKKGRVWWWSDKAGSATISDVRENVEREGGKLKRETYFA